MRVLLVDDEPRVVEALGRMLDCELDDIDVVTATSGTEALAELAAQPFDVVITDMRMPQMNGAELLEHVHGRWPEVVRLVLSGQMEPEASVRARPHTHQFLAKPCPADDLVGALERARRLRDWATNPRARAVLAEFAALRWQPTPTGREPADAGALLASVLAAAARCTPPDFDLAAFERTSFLCARRCAALEPGEDDRYAAGLVAQVGALVLAVVGAGSGATPSAATRSLADATPAEVAGYLLGTWGLSASVVEAVVHLADPARAPRESRRLTAQLHTALSSTFGQPVDRAVLRRAGFDAEVDRWLAVAGATR
jgi:DNA-binding NarL/FixJ family response regulator